MTNSSLADSSPLLRPFLNQVEVRPSAPCLNEGEQRLNYRQTARRAAAIAQGIRALNLPAGMPVAVALPRGIEATCAVLGILASSHPYLPLDTKAPPARKRQILEDARAVAIIGPQEEAPWLPHLPHAPETCEKKLASSVHREDLAAILYTSGSTGSPKGVALSHRAIAAFSDWARKQVNLSPSDRIAAIAPLQFDLSTFDLFAVLGAGACLDFLPEALTMMPHRFSAWLSERCITGFYTIPSLLMFWSAKGGLTEVPQRQLRFILFAGEPFPASRLRQLAKQLPNVNLFNFYGPTETNVCCCWPVDRARLAVEDTVPIGHPACGDELRIDPVDDELLVRGPTVLSGYWREGQLHPAVDGAGWYATGDRVSRNEWGEYVWLGRLDRMVKIAGHRIEPAEVETVLLALPAIHACTVTAVDTPDGTVLAAAVTSTAPIHSAALRKMLRDKLPGYMIPTRFSILKTLPRLANGKVDLEAVTRLLKQKSRPERAGPQQEEEEV